MIVSLHPSLHTPQGGWVRDIPMSDQPQYYRVTDSLENLSVRIRLRKVRGLGPLQHLGEVPVSPKALPFTLPSIAKDFNDTA